MHRNDGSNSARARSARIRSEHEYEATRLESLWRSPVALEKHAERVSWWRAGAASLARVARRHGTSRIRDDIAASEPADAATGGR